MTRCLQQPFFNRPTITVARELLGKYLVRRHRGKTIAGIITEVEIYDGFKDKASHASRGLTKRNFPMFGLAGYWYVYFTYGIHWMLNIVTGKEGYPAAILIRGVNAKIDNKKHSNILQNVRMLSGPGKVTKYFKIDKFFNNKKAGRKTGLWIEERGTKISPSQIKHSARVGVAYAGPIWANKKYRFYIEK